MSICPKMWKSSILSSSRNTFQEYIVFPSLGGKFNSLGLDHSGSQPFNYVRIPGHQVTHKLKGGYYHGDGVRSLTWYI